MPWHFINWVARELAEGGPGVGGLLSFAVFVLLLVGLLFGLPAWVLLLAAVITVGGYQLRQTTHEKHLERMAALEVDNVRAKGEAMKSTYRKKLAARRQALLPFMDDTRPEDTTKDPKG